MFQSQYIEEELRKNGLACVVPGSDLFWCHEEVQDIVAFLRVIADPKAADSDLLQAVLTRPERGVEAGEGGRQRLYNGHKKSLSGDVSEELQSGLHAKSKLQGYACQGSQIG